MNICLGPPIAQNLLALCERRGESQGFESFTGKAIPDSGGEIKTYLILTLNAFGLEAESLHNASLNKN